MDSLDVSDAVIVVVVVADAEEGSWDSVGCGVADGGHTDAPNNRRTTLQSSTEYPSAAIVAAAVGRKKHAES